MGCVTPMFYCYHIGNKKKGHIVPRSEVMQELDFNPNKIRERLNELNSKSNTMKYIQVPCNHCWACQLRYSAEWATRIMLESQKYENNWFVTLTYDPEHLPVLESIRLNDQLWQNDGTWIDGSLMPEEIAKFIKDLRNHLQNHKHHQGMKYFYCGEYGEHTGRPHYHLILMNVPLDIHQLYDTYVDNNYKIHWKSKEIESLWPKGMIDVAELEWSCAAYVARYCTKKISFNVDKTIYYAQGKLPEFIRMSKGIGMDYFKENMDKIYEHDELIAKTVKGRIGSIKPPKAFDKKYQELHPREFSEIKRSRMKAAERTRKMLQEMSTYTDKKMLEMKAESLNIKMSLLPRSAEI